MSAGALASRGMVGFREELSSKELETLRHFIIGRKIFAHSIGDTQRTDH